MKSDTDWRNDGQYRSPPHLDPALAVPDDSHVPAALERKLADCVHDMFCGDLDVRHAEIPKVHRAVGKARRL
jgi:hypothetical protein